jgi:hypothetical protein
MTKILSCLGMLGLMIAAHGAYAGVALEDDFTYADGATMIAAGWVDTPVGTPAVANTYFFTGSGSNFIANNPANQPPVIADQSLARLGNTVTYKELGTTITTDWTLTANVAIAGYSRALQIGLGDATTGAGYSLHWNAGSPTTHLGHGFFTVVAQANWNTLNPIESNPPDGSGGFNLATAISGTSKPVFPTGYALPDPIFFDEDPGEPVVNKINYSPASPFLGFSELKLTWSPTTNVLEAHINNAQIPDEETLIVSVDFDTLGIPVPYSSFSRVYLSGGTNSFIDNVKVESSQIIENPNDPGDFDGDGDVDGRDFLIWQRGESETPLSPGDLLDWQENYGAGTPLVSTIAVPEPSAALLFGLAASCLMGCRHGAIGFGAK